MRDSIDAIIGEFYTPLWDTHARSPVEPGGPRFSEMVSGVSSADQIGFRILKALCSTD
jgi:hypothetical protein